MYNSSIYIGICNGNVGDFHLCKCIYTSIQIHDGKCFENHCTAKYFDIDAC